MKIAAASIQLSSSHVAFERTEVSERLDMWVGRRPDDGTRPGVGLPRAEVARPQVHLSKDAMAAQEADALAEQSDPLDADPRMKLLSRLIELLTGRPARLLRLDGPAGKAASPTHSGTNAVQGAPARAGFGIAYAFDSTYTEFEQTQFQAQGVIRTTDGQELRFDVAFAMQRSYTESVSVRFTAGDARLTDPLVLDFGGPAAALSNARFAFDLNADGVLDDIPLLGGGSGFLAIDRNGNGQIDNGRELFGPTSGNGFTELAALDEDGSGWIDEADPAFALLRVWRPAAQGAGSLQTLAEAGVGALYLGNVTTPFDLRGPGNETLGVMRASSIYVRDNGTVGTVSQIDLSV
ncbi:MAG TPA: hypothetical protein PK725_02645 [Rhodocyclaceae bacterium]|nr:hypothetical protein [Rhodocyclaceae bacterium]